MPLYANVRNPYVATQAEKNQLRQGGPAASRAFTQRVKALGHDGVVMAQEDGGIELVVFEPTQVKSATGNNGAFDGTNSDIRYSRNVKATSNSTAIQLRRAMTQRTVDGLAKGWSQRPDIVVVNNMQDPAVPEAVRREDETQRSQGAAGNVEGFWYSGKVYLVADALPSSQDVARVLYHEVLGHHGLRGHFGPALDRVRDQVAKMRPKDIQAKAEEYGLDLSQPAHVRYAAEEVLAEMAQTRPDLALVQRAIAAIRTFLREHVPGFKNLELTDSEIVRNYLLPARGFIERGGLVDDGNQELAYSRSAMKSVDANITRGRASLAKALTERTSVHRAMFRNGLGWVDFVWGAEGVIKPNGKTKGAMGLSHILEARQRKDGMSEQEAISSLSEMVSTIASGREIDRGTYGNTVSVKVEYDGFRVGMVKTAGSNAWVVTAFEVNQVQGRPDIDARLSTQSKSTLPRSGLGAGSVAPGDSVPSLDRATRRDSTERGSPAGAGDVSSLTFDRDAGNNPPDRTRQGGSKTAKSVLQERAQTNQPISESPSAISGQSTGASLAQGPAAQQAPRSTAQGNSSEVTPKKDGGEAPQFSRSQPQTAISSSMEIRPSPLATTESVRAAIGELVNGLGMLPNRLGRVVVATSAEIKRDWEPLIGPAGMEASGVAGQAQGFYDPQTRTVFVIADHISAGDELGVVAHELMHKHGQAVLGRDGWNQLYDAIGGWASAPKDSMERIVYDEAARRVEASGPVLSNQELFPYAVQVSLEMGIRPNGGTRQGTVAHWLAQARSTLRAVWNKLASSKGDFNSLDLVNLAFGIAQRENPAHASELDAETVAASAVASDALKQKSEKGELFALPKSDKKSIAAITADHDPTIRVRTSKSPEGETVYTLSMPDGTSAQITSRPAVESAVYGMDEKTGAMLSERPGEKAPPVGSRDNIWIDVSTLKPGQTGGLVYNIAATYAHNNGSIFIGDPAGLSNAALRRRAEQMLSSALKFGTTDHLAPHPRQAAGDAALGVPPLRWVYGDHVSNIERLMDVNLQALDNANPDAKNLIYELDTSTFRDASDGGALSREQMAEAFDRRVRSDEEAAYSGWRTVARGAVMRAVLQGSREQAASDRAGTGRESGQGGSRVLDGRVRQPDQPASSADRELRRHSGILVALAGQRDRLASSEKNQRIFYSRQAGGVAPRVQPKAPKPTACS